MLSVRPLVKVLPHVRNVTSNIAGPPSRRMSLVERLCHGAVIMVSSLAIPSYVLLNLRHYRGLE